jgi:hypothetical protein
MRGTDFGWDYPPGMPGPRKEEVDVRCRNKDCPGLTDEDYFVFPAILTTDLGAGDLDPEECPECGEYEWLEVV